MLKIHGVGDVGILFHFRDAGWGTIGNFSILGLINTVLKGDLIYVRRILYLKLPICEEIQTYMEMK